MMGECAVIIKLTFCPFCLRGFAFSYRVIVRWRRPPPRMYTALSHVRQLTNTKGGLISSPTLIWMISKQCIILVVWDYGWIISRLEFLDLSMASKLWFSFNNSFVSRLASMWNEAPPINSHRLCDIHDTFEQYIHQFTWEYVSKYHTNTNASNLIVWHHTLKDPYVLFGVFHPCCHCFDQRAVLYEVRMRDIRQSTNVG